MYLYENHMGGFYTTDYEQDQDDLYCEQCGDSDRYIGEVNIVKDALDLLLSSSWLDDYIYLLEFIDKEFGVDLLLPDTDKIQPEEIYFDKDGDVICKKYNDYCDNYYSYDETGTPRCYQCGFKLLEEIVKINLPETLNKSC